MTGLEYWKAFIYQYTQKWLPEYIKYFGDPLHDSLPLPPKIYGERTFDTLSKQMPKEVRNPNNGSMYPIYYRPFDGRKLVTSKFEVERFLKEVRINIVPENRKYWTNPETGERKSYNDCDDNAVRLWGKMLEWHSGLFCGYFQIWKPSHALTFFMDEKDTLWQIEASSKVISPLDKENANAFIS